MAAYLVDTNALIDGVWPDGEVAVSVLTFAELLTGVHAAPEGPVRTARQVRFDRLRSAFDPLPVTASVLDAYADIDAAEVAAGRKPRRRRVDLLIAATARAHDLTVWTSNLDDYAAIRDLVAVEGP